MPLINAVRQEKNVESMRTSRVKNGHPFTYLKTSSLLFNAFDCVLKIVHKKLCIKKLCTKKREGTG